MQQTQRRADRHPTYRQTDRETDRQTDRQTDKGKQMLALFVSHRNEMIN